MSMSFTYTQYFDHNKKYNLLNSIIDKGIKQRKMVCNPIRQVGAPTQHGSYIYMQVGCEYDGYLLHPSLHLSLAMDLVTEDPHRLKERNGEDSFLQYGKRRIYGSKILGPSIY
jgi:hypothetical protein